MDRADHIRGIRTGVGIPPEAVPGNGIAVVIHQIDIAILIVFRLQAGIHSRLDLIYLTLGQLHQRAGLDDCIREQAAEGRCHAPAGDAVIHGHVLVAVFRRSIFGIAVYRSHPGNAPGIGRAGRRGQLAGIQADRYTLEGRPAVEGHGRLPLMQRLHDHLPQTGGGVTVVASQIDLLRLVIATPHSCGVVASVTAEPAVPVAGSCAGLTGNVLALENGCAAGAEANGCTTAG